MTFLEKAMEIENETEKGLKREEVIQRYCPSSYDLEAGNGCSMSALEKCRICWNREMPNTEPKADGIPVIPQSEVDAYNKGHADGMAQGLNDAWELAKKVALSPEYVKNAKIFIGDNICGIEYKHLLCGLFKLTPQEALEKLKAYEDSKIEVGDVVAWTDFADDTFNGVVLDFKDNTDNEVVVFNENGCVDVWKIAECKKTGKHLEISSILEQIGE